VPKQASRSHCASAADPALSPAKHREEAEMSGRASRSRRITVSRRSLPSSAAAALAVALALAACGKEEKAAAPEIRPVRTVTVEPRQIGETLSLTGEIRPRYEADIGFRVQGKILKRPVDVGSAVKNGDLLARLDPQQYRQDVEVAKADVKAADAEVDQSRNQESRQRELLKNGHTTQVKFDQAVRAFKTALAQADAARAKLVQATENLGYTELRADHDGVVTAVGADAGQVVGAGQMVVRLAQPGEREAVFNVSEAHLVHPQKDPTVTVKLVSDPAITAQGKVRYVSPQADPATRTYTVRVALPKAPPEMRLGATVTGSVTINQAQVISLPSTALFDQGGKPAVWLVRDGAVELKPIAVARYGDDSFVVGSGLAQGDIVVTGGVQKLVPGEKVRLMAADAGQ
jgi:membrane fusion protein, multidrug efflux system